MSDKRNDLIRKASYFSLLLLFLLTSGCAINPVTGKQDFVLMSESDEMSLGRRYSTEVMKKYRLYADSDLQKYVQNVGQKLAKVSHRNALNYHFTLLDSTEVNAFALPGGYIYITRGLLAYLNSEDELAAVLGHELGHVTARHSVRQNSLSTTTNLLGAVFAAATGVREVGQLSQLVSTGIVRGYGREHELEADRLGLEYLAKAGYSTGAMRRVIGILKNQEVFERKVAIEQGRQPRVYHAVFATHPDNDTRLQEVLLESSRRFVVIPEKTKQDVSFLKRLDGLTFGDSEEDGVARGHVFYHKSLNVKFNIPKNWLFQNGINAIQLSAPNSAAILQIRVNSLDRDLSPREFMREKLGVAETLSEKPLKLASYRGYTAVVGVQTAYGLKKTRVTVLMNSSHAYTVMATAKQDGKFAQYDDVFLKTAKSFSTLSRKDKREAREFKIKLVWAPRTTKLSSLVKSSPIAHHAEAQLRLLNNLFPKGEPKLGDLIKIVR